MPMRPTVTPLAVCRTRFDDVCERGIAVVLEEVDVTCAAGERIEAVVGERQIAQLDLVHRKTG